MRRLVQFFLAIVVGFSTVGLSGVNSELVSNEDEIPKLTQADLNYVWLESKGSQTLGYNTLKVVNAYVGQTLTETLEVRNKSKETLNYSLTTELMDCENKEVWQDGDKLAMKLAAGKLTLKGGEKKQVQVTVQVQKNHSGNAYFRIFITPSKGKKEFVSLNICQFDTKADIMTTKPPVMFKALNDALKNKTKLGRLIRKPDKTFLIYGNIHLFCFDSKTGKFSWYYNNKTSIIDITIYEGFIFTQNSEKMFVKDGKACVHGENDIPIERERPFRFTDFALKERIFKNLGMTSSTLFCYGDELEDLNLYKSNLKSEHTWFGTFLDFDSPFYPDLVYDDCGGHEGPNILSLRDLQTGNLVCDLGLYYRIVYKPSQKLLIIYDGFGSLNIHDMVSCKNIFSLSVPSSLNSYVENKFVLMVTDTGTSIVFTDYKEVGAYDYNKRKVIWRYYGDGEPLCDPAYDNASNSVYILDEDSKADKEGNITKKAEYLRLFRFDATTGKQFWKAVLFKIPKDSDPFDWSIEIKGDKVTVNFHIISSEYTITIRASDGKPAK